MAVAGRQSFYDYRQACLDHETFLRCLGLADILCASAGALAVAIGLRNLTGVVGQRIDWLSFRSIQWVIGSFVFLTALLLVLVKLGIELPRRNIRAWRAQVLLSGLLIFFVSLTYGTSVVRDPRSWQSMAAAAVFAANAFILGSYYRSGDFESSRHGTRRSSPPRHRSAATSAFGPSLAPPCCRRRSVWACSPSCNGRARRLRTSSSRSLSADWRSQWDIPRDQTQATSAVGVTTATGRTLAKPLTSSKQVRRNNLTL